MATKKNKYALFFIVGFLGLSSLTNEILSAAGIGFYLLEIFLIPAIAIIYNDIKRNDDIRFNINKILFCVLLILLSTIIGIINTMDIFGTITCIRPLFYMCLISIILSQCKESIDVWYFWWLAAGATLGEYVFIKFFSVRIALVGYSHINILAIALMIVIPFIKRKLAIGIISSIITIIIAFMSGYRINILVWLIAIVVSSIYYMRLIKLYKGIFLFILLLILALLAWNNIYEIIEFLVKKLDLNSESIYRIVNRTMSLFEGNKSLSDSYRLEGYKSIVTDFIPKLILQGPVGKSLGASYFGKYTDVPIEFLYDCFGSILAWIIVMIYFVNGISSFARTIICRKESDLDVLCGLCFPIMLVLFIVNGTFMTFAHISILAGITMSCWRVTNKIKLRWHSD